MTISREYITYFKQDIPAEVCEEYVRYLTHKGMLRSGYYVVSLETYKHKSEVRQIFTLKKAGGKK